MTAVAVSCYEVATDSRWTRSDRMNWSFVLLQPEGTSFCRLSPVFFKGWERRNWLQSSFSRLGQKTGPSRTFKHYFHIPPHSFSVAALCIPFQVSIHVFFNLVSAVPFSPDQTDLVRLTTLKVGGPWSATSGPPLCRRPLMTVGHPPPTAVVEL